MGQIEFLTWAYKSAKEIRKSENKSGIYRITNTLNGRIYIGSSNNLYRRLVDHYHLLTSETAKHSNTHLQRSVRKHGIGKFEVDIIEFCESEKRLEREQYYLDTLLFAQEFLQKKDRRFTYLGYNAKATVIMLGEVYSHSPERTLQKRREATKAMWENPEWREKIMGIRNDPRTVELRVEKFKETVNSKDYQSNHFVGINLVDILTGEVVEFFKFLTDANQWLRDRYPNKCPWGIRKNALLMARRGVEIEGYRMEFVDPELHGERFRGERNTSHAKYYAPDSDWTPKKRKQYEYKSEEEKRRNRRLANIRKWTSEAFREKRAKTVATPEWKEAASLRHKEIISRPGMKEKIKAGRDKWLASEERIKFLEETKERRSQVGKDIWKDPDYLVKQERTPERKEKWSQSGKANWADEKYRKKQLQAISNPETNKKRAQSVSETRSNPEFSCRWFRKVFAYDLETGELAMTFNNSKLAHDWIKENRGDTKGLGFSIRVLLEKYKDTGILGYRWKMEESFENKKG